MREGEGNDGETDEKEYKKVERERGTPLISRGLEVGGERREYSVSRFRAFGTVGALEVRKVWV